MENSERFLKELGEYRLLCAGLKELHLKYEERKTRLRLLLEELEGLRRRALRELGKASRFARHLAPFQRNELGLPPFNMLAEKKQKEFPSLDPASLPVLAEQYSNPRELKAGTLGLLSQIDGIKKSLLQLDLLELRVRELLLSINKALKAYAHEYRVIRRRIYPLYILSALGKSWRRFRGMTYFSPRDIIELTALGDLTVNIARMAESPVL